MKKPLNPSRPKGKTLSMVLALPEGGALVIVHTQTMVRYMREMIIAFRGAEFFQKCSIFAVQSSYDLNRLMGHKGPLWIDHAVFQTLPHKALDELHSRMMQVNSMYPPEQLQQFEPGSEARLLYGKGSPGMSPILPQTMNGRKPHA